MHRPLRSLPHAFIRPEEGFIERTNCRSQLESSPPTVNAQEVLGGSKAAGAVDIRPQVVGFDRMGRVERAVSSADTRFISLVQTIREGWKEKVKVNLCRNSIGYA